MRCETEDLKWALQVGGIATRIHNDKTKVYRSHQLMFTEDESGIPYEFDPNKYVDYHWDVISPQQLRKVPPSHGIEVVRDEESNNTEW